MKKVDFVYLVAQMRDAQKEYFRYRLRRDLDKCKDFEKRVDSEITKWKRQCYDNNRKKHLNEMTCYNCASGKQEDEDLVKCDITGELMPEQWHCILWNFNKKNKDIWKK